ncbi:lipid-binding SYLF domain-containing protein [Bythopirellula polymerisocia]|uniref:Ysc84 actin-binding domain-containing protein n=1 Tax=Bythopirellula polymerisocia TaxID=2528003 RepID=A0A5C6CES5_9BACT|nr:lipid-binding SYLF domain-containing protein [Bythopirellula polymerisocia]TWU22602.1 hypothetical protein Pla144_40620 [Bythopirellula polymerisocia]
MLPITRLFLFATMMLSLVPAEAKAQAFSEDETLRQASNVFQQVMAAPGNGIPKQLLSDAQGVAIIPQVKGGAFVIGIRMGRGVFIGRGANGQWEMPRFIDLTGGSVGWQAGIQSTDVILVFRSRESVANLLQGKLTVGADASVAAGPVGRQVSAGTDLPMNAEIYSYSRSRGAFLGVSLDGSVIKQDAQADAAYYQQAAAAGQQPVLASQLVTQIAQYAGGAPTQMQPQPNPNQFAAPTNPLSESWQRLDGILTPEWKQYLAIPTANEFNNAEAYREALIYTQARYETIASNPQYAQLSARPEFQAAYGLLRHAVSSQIAAPEGQLVLPPPPMQGGTPNPNEIR